MPSLIDTPLWYAFYVRPRHEKKVAERLAEREIEHYCPTISTKVRWSDRWKKVTKPLLPGYILAHVTNADRIRVLEDPSVVSTVMWRGKPAVIREEEIETMRVFLERKGTFSTEQWSVGDLAKINNGMLKGREGEVIELSNSEACLYVESLQTLIKVRVSLAEIEKKSREE